MPVGTEKVAGSTKNMPIGAEKVAGSTGRHDHTSQKMPFESFEAAYQQRGYNEPTIQSLNRLFDEITANQVFSSTYLVKVLGCAERTARNIMKKLREMDVVVPVSGKGKGMYRLKYKSET